MERRRAGPWGKALGQRCSPHTASRSGASMGSQGPRAPREACGKVPKAPGSDGPAAAGPSVLPGVPAAGCRQRAKSSTRQLSRAVPLAQISLHLHALLSQRKGPWPGACSRLGGASRLPPFQRRPVSGHEEGGKQLFSLAAERRTCTGAASCSKVSVGWGSGNTAPPLEQGGRGTGVRERVGSPSLGDWSGRGSFGLPL